MAQEQTIESLATGSARLPAFHANDPHLWFIQIEAQFAAERVTTETTKFNRVVSQLPIDVLQQITDLVETPGTSPYTQLKTRLSSLYTDSQEDQLLALLHDTPIGDQKPSLALNRLRYIAGKDTPLAIVKTIWIKRLPTSIQQNLMTAGESDINKLAALADRLIALERPSVAALNTSTDLSTLKDQVDNLTKELRRLTSSRQRVYSRDRSSSRHRDRSIDKPREKGPTREFRRQRDLTPHSTSCYYHRRFGDKAKKCVPPCSHQQEN
ncbi:hypothetical protein GE061_003465 [Apolygus lucorum]|uniref:DUF7041 domain-containing protein n=1 Tax=Apolygus lucorum TaxID=248454 RepID=A0A6A4JIN8_APOLU|nr:hypothetical protein GE061_003465 [Apolygus lucorum]